MGVKVGNGVGVSVAGMMVTKGGGSVDVGVAGADLHAVKTTSKKGNHFFIGIPERCPSRLLP